MVVQSAAPELVGDDVTGPAAHPAPWVEVRETHSGVVLLMGDVALKFKKPVDLGFLDFTSLARRQEDCRREVELNQRLAPDVYVGTGELHGPGGTVLDHVVIMRRMPEERRLAHLVAVRDPHLGEQVRQVARRLAAFHAEGGRITARPDGVTADSLLRLWRTSFEAMRRDHLERVVPTSVELAVEQHVERYLAGRVDLLERRRLTGSVVDGHGDLLAEDIFCLDDGPRILDCLEFDDRLRTVDQVDDAAFLAMDLERLGAGPLATQFLGWYAEFSGDAAPASLVDHYVAYRAFVRAKVACVRQAQGDAASAGEARRLLEICLRHLDRAAVKLVLVGGVPGTGKSALAGALADRLGMTLLSSDRLRKELAGLPPLASATAAWGEGIYSEEWSRRVDEELLHRAELLMAQGESVVLDSTWSKQWRREHARRVAQESNADLVEIECQAPAPVVEERLRLRGSAVSAAGTRSDAGPEVGERVRDAFDPWRAAHVLDTDQPLADVLAQAEGVVRPATPTPVGRRSLIEPD